MYLNFEDFYKNYLNLKEFKVLDIGDYYFLWKIWWIASSFWKSKSVLNLIENDLLDNFFCLNQKNNFTKDYEYGLLNRLDNMTNGFLYFAKNLNIYHNFKKNQKLKQFEKVYYAKVDKNFPYEEIKIKFPIMHKNNLKMIVIKSKLDERKWRWKKHFVKTYVKRLKQDDTWTWLKIKIFRWVRHQIRAHLSSICFPIIWDSLYNWKKDDKLYLFSVWVENLYFKR